MASKKQPDILKTWDVREMIRRGKISSEIEFERAILAERSLALHSKSQPELEILRKDISILIGEYESLNWTDFESISRAQFDESDLAEKQAQIEFKFIAKRKKLIIESLRKYGLNQNDLAAILSHNKSYTSELLSGTRAFSMADLIIIHKLFHIKLDELFFTEIPIATKCRIKDTLSKKAANAVKSKNAMQVSFLVKTLFSKSAFSPNETTYEFPA